MKARSFSHSGITVSNFNRAVKFYWDVFGCPLVGVADTPPDRVRTFFGVQGERCSCRIGWSALLPRLPTTIWSWRAAATN